MTETENARMFNHCEKERALASQMTNEELAAHLLSDVINDIDAAESEFGGEDQCRLDRGAVREAAYRLAGIRDYQP